MAILASVELYDGTNWTSGTSIPTATAGMAGSGTQTSAIVFAGTTGSMSANSFNFDGTSWTAGATMALARNRLGGSPAGTQSTALAVSGNTPGGNQTATEEFNLSIFSPIAATWASGGALNSARDEAGGASQGTQTAALAFGGYNSGALNVTEEYNGTHGQNKII